MELLIGQAFDDPGGGFELLPEPHKATFRVEISDPRDSQTCSRTLERRRLDDTMWTERGGSTRSLQLGPERLCSGGGLALATVRLDLKTSASPRIRPEMFWFKHRPSPDSPSPQPPDAPPAHPEEAKIQ